MTKVKLDEEFLQWWERGLEEEGYDLHKKQLKVLADPTKSLYHVYSYHEFFNAMRRGEYAALLAYDFFLGSYPVALLRPIISLDSQKD